MKEKNKQFLKQLYSAFKTLAFSVVFVSLFTMVFGKENSSAGIAILLGIFTFKNVHLGYDINHSIFSIFIIYLIYAISPQIANSTNIYLSCIINFLSMLLILVIGCAKIEFYNHAVLMLSYLLIYASPVSGKDFAMRAVSLVAGGILLSLWMFHHHKEKNIQKSLKDVFKEFKLTNKQSLWMIKLSSTISLSILIGHLTGIKKPVWIAIASMSVLTPFIQGRKEKFKDRFVGTVIGCLLFFVLFALIPEKYNFLYGIIGGIFVGLVTSYKYKTVFNSIGALGILMATYGPLYTIFTRITANLIAIIFAAIYSYIFDHVIYKHFKKYFDTDEKIRV